MAGWDDLVRQFMPPDDTTDENLDIGLDPNSDYGDVPLADLPPQALPPPQIPLPPQRVAPPVAPPGPAVVPPPPARPTAGPALIPPPAPSPYAALDPTQQRSNTLVPVALATWKPGDPQPSLTGGGGGNPLAALGTLFTSILGGSSPSPSPAPGGAPVAATPVQSTPGAVPQAAPGGSIPPDATTTVKPITLQDGRVLDRPPQWDSMSDQEKSDYVDINAKNAKKPPGAQAPADTVTSTPLPPAQGRPITLSTGQQIDRPPNWDTMTPDQRDTYVTDAAEGAQNPAGRLPAPASSLVPAFPRAAAEVGPPPPAPPPIWARDNTPLRPGALVPPAPPIPKAALAVGDQSDRSSALGDLRSGIASLRAGFAATGLAADARALSDTPPEIQTLLEGAKAARERGNIGRADSLEAQAAAEQKRLDVTRQTVGSHAKDVDVLNKQAQAEATSPQAEKFFNASTWSDAGNALWADPYSVMRTVALRSIPASIPSAAASVAGGAVGSLGGPWGTAAGAGVGAGLGSGAVELGNEMITALQQEKVNLADPKAVEAYLSDPANADKLLTRITNKALVVGGVDAATAVLTAGIAKYFHPTTVAGHLGEHALNVGVQATGGAGGEALSELATGQDLQPGNIAGEAVGEGAMGVVELLGLRKFLRGHPVVATKLPLDTRTEIFGAEKFGPPERQGPAELQGAPERQGPPDVPITALGAAQRGRDTQAARAGQAFDEFMGGARRGQQTQAGAATGASGGQVGVFGDEGARRGQQAQAATAGQKFDPIFSETPAGVRQRGQQVVGGAVQSARDVAAAARAKQGLPPLGGVQPPGSAPPAAPGVGSQSPGAAPLKGKNGGKAGFAPAANVDTSHLSGDMQQTYGALSQEFQSAGLPVQVDSGYRSPEYNQNVGGAKDSAHTRGNAIDVSLAGMSEEQQQRTVDILLANPNIRGFGYYPKSNSIHVDVDTKNHPTNMAWGSNYSRTSIGKGWPDWLTQKVNGWTGGNAATSSNDNAPAQGQAGGGSGLARFIAGGEGGGAGYDALVYGKGTPKSIPLTNMSLRQVQEYQNGMLAAGHASTAVGKYQVIKGTLAGAMKALGLSPDTQFTPQVQDQIGQYLADQRGLSKWRAGQMDDATFLKGMREEWESLRNVPDAQILAEARKGWGGGGGTNVSTSTPPQGELLPPSDVNDTTDFGGTTPATPSEGSGSQGAPASAQPPTAFSPQNALVSMEVPQLQSVSTAAGKISTKPIVVEASSIMSSDTPGYDQSLQPRDRSRVASQAQVNEIASNLDPNRLGVTAEADRGAPIINDRGMVESGNGRTMAIRQAYQQGRGQAYRDHLQSLGYDVSGMKEPILVQQRQTQLTPEQVQSFVHGANKPTALAMSSTEQAAADAKHINPEMLAHLGNGNPDPATNSGFRGAFMKNISATERGGMVDKDGNLSQAGQTRLRNALLAHAYGDSPAIQRTVESADNNTRSLSGAMQDAAPAMAALKQKVSAGTVDASFDQSDKISDAVNRISDMREKGQSLDSYMAQDDAFNPIDPDTALWMRMMYSDTGKRQLSRERVASAMRFYAQEAAKTTPAGQGFDFGTEAVQPRDVLTKAQEKLRDDGQGNSDQADLLGSSGGGPDTGANGPRASGPATGAQVRGPNANQTGAAAPVSRRPATGAKPQANKPAKVKPSTVNKPLASGGAATITVPGVPPSGAFPSRTVAQRVSNYVHSVKASYSLVRPVATAAKSDKGAGIHKLIASLGYSAGGELHMLANQADSAPLRKIANMFATLAGTFDEKGKGTGADALEQRAYDQAVDIEHTRDLNTLSGIMMPLLGQGKDSKVNLAKFDRWMRDDNTIPRGVNRTDPVFNAVMQAREWLGQKLDYMHSAGADVGDAGVDYYKRNFDPIKVIDDEAGFKRRAAQEYRAIGLTPQEADDSAQGLYDVIAYGDQHTPGDFTTKGSSTRGSSITKSRVFGPTANRTLAAYYQDDPIANLMSYSLQSTKRAEAARRLGGNNEDWVKLMNKARDDGVPESVRNRVTSLVQAIMGENDDRQFGNRAWDRIINAGNTAATLGMLDKSVFASVGETMMPAIRRSSGMNPIHIGQTIVRTIHEMMRETLTRGSPSEARQMAELLGTVQNTYVSTLAAMRHSFDLGERWDYATENLKGRFFRANLLTQLTMAQNVAATQQARGFLKDQARRAGKGSSQAEDYLRELGVPNDKMSSFINWMNDPVRNGKPFAHEVVGQNVSEEGKLYQAAVHLFARQSIQEPKGSDRPRWMASKWGQLAGQFTSFNWATGKNVMMRMVRLEKQAFTPGNGWSMAERTKAAGAPLFSLGLMYLTGAAVTGPLRRWMFEDERRNREKLTGSAQAFQTAGQSGVLGPFEPIASLVFGYNPNRPVGNFAPPVVNMIAQPMQQTLNYYWADKAEKTNSAARKRARAYLNLMDVPLNTLANLPAVPAAIRTPATLASEYFKANNIDRLAGPETKRVQEGQIKRRKEAEKSEWPFWRDLPGYTPPQSTIRR